MTRRAWSDPNDRYRAAALARSVIDYMRSHRPPEALSPREAILEVASAVERIAIKEFGSHDWSEMASRTTEIEGGTHEVVPEEVLILLSDHRVIRAELDAHTGAFASEDELRNPQTGESATVIAIIRYNRWYSVAATVVTPFGDGEGAN